MTGRIARTTGIAATMALLAGSSAIGQQRPALFDLWGRGQPAFGVFVPTENADRRNQTGDTPAAPGPAYTAAGVARLASNPLYDFLFLNLEGGYDATYVRAAADGVATVPLARRPALLVRIPSIADAGGDLTAARVKEVLALGANGVTLPHIRNVDEARQAIGFFAAAGRNVWSPARSSGDTIAMLMLEDPDAVGQASVIADLPGYSILACGIGSLRSALGGDREGAERGVQRVLAETKRAGLVNMLTAGTGDVDSRVQEGFLALLMQGRTADEAIRIGRRAAGRHPLPFRP